MGNMLKIFVRLVSSANIGLNITRLNVVRNQWLVASL